MKRARNWKSIQLAKARARAAVNRTQAPPKPRRRRAPIVTKSRFLRALKGSHGNKTVIMERLNVSYPCVCALLKRPGWEDVQEAFQAEVDYVGDIAEQTILDAITQRLDLNTASLNARWLLTRQRYAKRGLGDVSKVQIEGGDNPLRIESTVPVESLDLPVEVKRQILEAMERKSTSTTNDNG